MKKLVLASGSIRRRELLEEQGFKFEVWPSHAEETLEAHLTPMENALNLAKMKALSVAQEKEGVILAADTLVAIRDIILGKPKDYEDALRMLKMLSGTFHEVITAFFIYDTTTKKYKSQAVVTKVKFKKLTDSDIEGSLKHSHFMDKAGAYGIQSQQEDLIEDLQGSYSNVMGLPMEEVIGALKAFGF